MVTYAQLWAASPPAWAGLAVALRRLARRVAAQGQDVALLARRLRAAWTGAAGEAAQRRLASVRSDLGARVTPLIAADQALAEFAAGLVRAKAVLSATVEATGGTPVTVDRDGRVAVCGPGAVAVAPLAERTVAGIRWALDLAASADAEAAGRLTAVRAEATPTPPGWTPPSGAAPATVAAWWAALTGAERRWLLLNRPELIGPLDGVPAAARDQANRAVAGRLPGAEAWWDRAGPPRTYLLRLDPRTGRAVVALGDPDRAEHVLVHVPGAGAGWNTVDQDLTRIDRVVERAAALAPAETVAAVLWLDYDVPDTVREVAGAGAARDAGPGLDRFVDGLRRSHADGAPPHVTVLGHSYGSLVVGVAARDHGLAADDVVFVGSPGTGVASADALHVPAAHVWSTTARQDPVQHVVPSLAQAGRDLALSVSMPGYASVALATPDRDLWHGPNPSLAGFGARVFASDPRPAPTTAHMAYWEHGNVALDNIARIALRLPL